MKYKGHHPCFLGRWRDLKNEIQHGIEGTFFKPPYKVRDVKLSEISEKRIIIFASRNTQHLGTHCKPCMFLNWQSNSRPEISGQYFINYLSGEIPKRSQRQETFLNIHITFNSLMDPEIEEDTEIMISEHL